MKLKIVLITFLTIAATHLKAQWSNSQSVAGAIYRNAKVGIGVGTNVDSSSPEQALHIKTTAGGDYGLRIESNNASSPGISFWDGAGTQNKWLIAIGVNSGVDGKFGIYDWRQGLHRLVIEPNGNVLIGKTGQANTTYKLDVNGSIRSNEVVVNVDGSDFVFEEEYELRNLAAVEQYIKQHKHLPDIAPATEMQQNGLALGQMDMKLLQKVEELTLYLIEQNKKIEAMEQKIKELEEKK
jgi:hypothetical protein